MLIIPVATTVVGIEPEVGNMAAIGRTDAIVFTAGVGEMNPVFRGKMLEGLENMGIIIDPERNNASITRNTETCISADNSPIKVFVILPTPVLSFRHEMHISALPSLIGFPDKVVNGVLRSPLIL